MRVLGIETSCDETGIALYCTEQGLIAQALHSQIAMHEHYGGVVPELASRDHVMRIVPLIREVMAQANTTVQEVDAIAYTQGPGLAGALLVGASVANGLAWSLNKPIIGVHHLEGHLMSPLLSPEKPEFPFVALLVSGGHTQLLAVRQFGDYTLLGESIDDAAGEAFDKSAKLLGLGYPGGPAIAKLAALGASGRIKLPRPLLHSADLDFSFSGLKTAVLTQVNKAKARPEGVSEAFQADLAAELQQAIVDVLVKKSIAALKQTGMKQLVIAGGVSANQELRRQLAQYAASSGTKVFFPPAALCTDNGAMIALAGALRLQAFPELLETGKQYGFDVRPRWPLEELTQAR
jgi:N6-L-threonylcarbamoyladenine synthase